jgi:hypothetical protein
VTRSTKIFIGVCLLLLGSLGASATYAVVQFQRAGSVIVEVQEPRGGHVSIHAPAGLLNLMPVWVPRQACREIPADAWHYMDVARAVATELSELPDATLVEIDGPDEHVRIRVERGQLHVHVNSGEGTVTVALPLRSLDTTLRRLAAACG